MDTEGCWRRTSRKIGLKSDWIQSFCSMYGFVKQGEVMLSGNTKSSDGCWADKQAYSLLVLTEGEVRASYFKAVHVQSVPGPKQVCSRGRRKQTETEERGKRAGKGGTERGWGREASRERQSEGGRGRSVSFSGCQQHQQHQQQQQQQLGSGREVTGAEGEGVCARACVREACVLAERLQERERRLNLLALCAALPSVCRLLPFSPGHRHLAWWHVKRLKVWHAKMVSAKKKEPVTAMRPAFIRTLFYFFCLATWWVSRCVCPWCWNLLLPSDKTTPMKFLFFFSFLTPKLWYPDSFFFLSSVKKISGQTKKDERIYPENFTRILDRLLDGYDNRLRPGFGGM